MFSSIAAKTDLRLSLDPMEMAYEAFRQAYPAFDTTQKLDELRATEYARLDRQGHVYLDYTGGGLYAESQLREHMALLSEGIFGNPHSKNLTSMAMTQLVEQARDYVLQYFNASPDEYMVIFTQNSTGALKLVGESYPFGPGDTYLLTFDNHNSVNGIREFARSKGATVTYIPIVLPDLRADEIQLAASLGKRSAGSQQPVRLPGAIQFHRRAASAGVDRAGASQRLGCAAGCGLLCAIQPAGSQPLASRLRRHLVLQNLRLPDRHGLPAGAQDCRPEAAASLVFGRHDHLFFCGGLRSLPDARPGRLRGWHGQLSEPAGGRNWAQDGSSRSGSI